jgi:hypothetical protein
MASIDSPLSPPDPVRWWCPECHRCNVPASALGGTVAGR